MIKKDRANIWDFVKIEQAGWFEFQRDFSDEGSAQKVAEADAEQGERKTRHDLVYFQGDTKETVKQCKNTADKHRCGHSDPKGPGSQHGSHCRQRTHQHHALDAEVQYA